MTIRTRTVEYTHQDVVLEGYLAWDDAHSGPRPCVIISHAFRGREAFECQRAEDLAALGYVGFALDLYGKGVLAETTEEASALMSGFMEDRPLLQSRLLAAVDVAREQPEVDAENLAAMGYCFGGLCVLDMARINAPLAGVVSFHGLLVGPGNTAGTRISPRVLA
ncbi:MAG: dienelactone hydrolase family protein, partial [Gammaproteobacteria bacterium]|nr:dienelactone hydrolase family protein [Gammaproteobacteria bacterium]